MFMAETGFFADFKLIQLKEMKMNTVKKEDPCGSLNNQIVKEITNLMSPQHSHLT